MRFDCIEAESHIARLCNQHNLFRNNIIDVTKSCAFVGNSKKNFSAPVVNSMQDYLANLHEIGHMVDRKALKDYELWMISVKGHPFANYNDKSFNWKARIEMEVHAWKWATSNSIFTVDMDIIRFFFGTYWKDLDFTLHKSRIARVYGTSIGLQF